MTARQLKILVKQRHNIERIEITVSELIMISASLFLEKFLQQYRFRLVRPHLIGDVLDFGGNQGELRNLVTGDYMVVNYDHSALQKANPDTIIALAVIEHIDMSEVFRVFQIFKNIIKPEGRIFLTTPTPMARPVLELLARFGFLEKENIAEHKHYWTKADINTLAEENGFFVKKYRKFQGGFNQYAILEPRP